MNHSTEIKVLSVDDHPCCHEAIETALKGYPEFVICERAMSGLELLEKLETVQPDIIIMDSRMPLMDGVEATTKVKERYPHIKVLAYSSALGLPEMTEFLQAGADGCLQKASGGNELRSGIKSLVAGNNWFCSRSTRILVELLQGKSS